ncbi:hypothetical protein [Lelliottia nimipressuralis]|uniref:Uncharacterized protein n=1 Tax=Lelliottia nimipressuralis TaxID=69220 RepID=A0ABY3P6B3_9ENTR|nr:hypothetical protein [Lelliottia nimipressuralis]RXJ10464.1 hypothetical protein ETG88_20095 [Lelliottia nimipressuralis]TYT34967.1 hypothetical protein FZO59_04855 [Lelliottia nimipressuralis]
MKPTKTLPQITHGELEGIKFVLFGIISTCLTEKQNVELSASVSRMVNAVDCLKQNDEIWPDVREDAVSAINHLLPGCIQDE